MDLLDLHLQTALMFDSDGHIISTREPESSRGPKFYLVRSMARCAWAVRADVPHKLAAELDCLARKEPPVLDLRDAPVFAEQYTTLVGGQIDSGPAFAFPDALPRFDEIIFIDDLRLLVRNFQGWTASEIPGRLPMAAVVNDGNAVSICFCARRSDMAAEAGLETAAAYRGRGLGPRVTAAWALAVRASGRIPLYSTSWSNNASLAVARKLGLETYACTWSIFG